MLITTIASTSLHVRFADPGEIGVCLSVALEWEHLAACATDREFIAEAHEEAARLRIEAVEWLLLWVAS